jgi:DNA mismatch repair protein MutS
MSNQLALQDIAEELQQPQLTPMMQQYMDVKNQHPDCLVFYRMGDFYEMFFEDAVIGSKVLDIALTKRGKTEGTAIPMCGIPFHAYEQYMGKLIRAGHRVAICDQVETAEQAKERGGYKALVKREVVRIVTPGTVTEESLLSPNENNYLAVLYQNSLAWADLSTGELCVQHITDADSAIAVLQPKEVLIPQGSFDTLNFDGTITEQPTARFQAENGAHRIKQVFNVTHLDAFGQFNKSDMAALGALIEYIALTQKNDSIALQPPVLHEMDDLLLIDGATRRNLELTQTLQGQRNGSLIATVDRTVTNSGSRLLARHFSAPLAKAAAINQRLDAVTWTIENGSLRSRLRQALNSCPDIERALSRLSLGRGGPRDLAALRDGLIQANAVQPIFQNDAPELIRSIQKNLTLSSALIDLITDLQKALKEELPLLSRDGGFIATGYSPVIDEMHMLQHDSKKIMAQMQAKYVSISGIPTLKIKHNLILGFFVEVTPSVADKAFHTADPEKGPESRLFIHRQSLATAARFTTAELAELDKKISECDSRCLQLELQIFEEFIKRIQQHSAAIRTIAEALATLDVACAWGELAVTNAYTKPVIDASLQFTIAQGRHPVVEAALKSSATEFMANDCDLTNDQKLWLLTGPNMAGKSTFLRQNAIIAFMAQIGAYVPATSAHIGVVDRLFSRVGAADDLAQGKSTFMVEMVETAAIVHQATERSLVILDEIGRGTATFDGLSLAWSTLEHLHNANRCRGLFATHYHELTRLENSLSQMKCYTLNVREWKNDIIFLHEVIKGSANRSYGLHVAKLAGMPKNLLDRAATLLHELEQNSVAKTLDEKIVNMPLFTSVQNSAAETSSKKHPILSMLAEVDPDQLSPREALDILFQLKNKLNMENE